MLNSLSKANDTINGFISIFIVHYLSTIQHQCYEKDQLSIVFFSQAQSCLFSLFALFTLWIDVGIKAILIYANSPKDRRNSRRRAGIAPKETYPHWTHS